MHTCIHIYIRMHIYTHTLYSQAVYITCCECMQASTSNESNGSPNHETSSSAAAAVCPPAPQSEGSCNSHADVATLCELRSQIGRLSQVNKGLQQEVAALTNSKKALYCLWKVPSMEMVSNSASITPHHTLLESVPCHVTCKALLICAGGRSTLWAARYNTWLLIKLTPKGVVFSFLFSSFLFFSFLFFSFLFFSFLFFSFLFFSFLFFSFLFFSFMVDQPR